MICQNDFSTNSGSYTVPSNSIVSGVEGSSNVQFSPIKQKKAFKWNKKNKETAFFHLLQYAAASPQPPRQRFFEQLAAALGTSVSVSACTGFLRRWSKKAKDSGLSPEKTNEFLETVCKAPSFDEGCRIASLIFKMTFEDSQKFLDVCQANIVKQTLFKNTFEKSSSSASSTSKITSQKKECKDNSDQPLKKKSRAHHKWLPMQDQALEEIFEKCKKNQSVYKVVAKKFNKIFKLEISDGAIRKRIFNLRNDAINPAGNKKKERPWTQEEKDVLFDFIWKYVKNGSTQAKEDLYSDIGKVLDRTRWACSTRSNRSRWFSIKELELLETKWTDENETSLVKIVSAESTLDEGFNVASKKFNIQFWECKTRFEEIILFQFYENGIINNNLKLSVMRKKNLQKLIKQQILIRQQKKGKQN